MRSIHSPCAPAGYGDSTCAAKCWTSPVPWEATTCRLHSPQALLQGKAPRQNSWLLKTGALVDRPEQLPSACSTLPGCVTHAELPLHQGCLKRTMISRRHFLNVLALLSASGPALLAQEK